MCNSSFKVWKRYILNNIVLHYDSWMLLIRTNVLDASPFRQNSTFFIFLFSSWMDTVRARHSVWIDNFWQKGNVRHESAASFPEGILFLRAILLRFAASYPESTTGRNMASYATSSWTISTGSSFRYQGNKLSFLNIIRLNV